MLESRRSCTALRTTATRIFWSCRRWCLCCRPALSTRGFCCGCVLLCFGGWWLVLAADAAPLLWQGDDRSAIDELPFLDTDLARGTFVLTAEDFAFFVVEHDLNPELVTKSPKVSSNLSRSTLMPISLCPYATSDLLCRSLIFFEIGHALLCGAVYRVWRRPPRPADGSNPGLRPRGCRHSGALAPAALRVQQGRLLSQRLDAGSRRAARPRRDAGGQSRSFRSKSLLAFSPPPRTPLPTPTISNWCGDWISSANCCQSRCG